MTSIAGKEEKDKIVAIFADLNGIAKRAKRDLKAKISGETFAEYYRYCSE